MDRTENSHQGLAEFLSKLPPVDDEGDPVEAMLTGFVLISEWIDGEGNRYLTKRSGNGAGESVPGWDSKGLLFEALFGDLI